jgi:hypothetical protein
MCPAVVETCMSIDSNGEPPLQRDEPGPATERLESCDRCGCETPHEVFVHLFVESSREENAAYSREPYRVSVCQRCDAETVRRMNGA